MPISIPIGKIEHWECYPFLDKVHTHTPSEETPPPTPRTNHPPIQITPFSPQTPITGLIIVITKPTQQHISEVY